MATGITGIFDLAAYQARKLGIRIDQAKVNAILERLKTDQTLNRIALGPTLENVVMAVDGVEAVFQWTPGERPVIKNVFHPHPKGLMTDACSRHNMTSGLKLSPDTVKRIIRDVEANPNKTSLGDNLFEATVKAEGDRIDVVYDARLRRVVRLTPHVLRYATIHAVERAKQRYHLPLTSEAAEEMVALMKAGKYVRNQPGPHQQKDTIRGTVHWDMEDFTVVYDPKAEKIVTVTPLGDYDRKRALRGE